MNAMVSKMVNAYGQNQVDGGVASASPHKLISMLYEGALVAIAKAGVHMARGDVAERGVAISKAIAIVEEGLKASVDLKAGGELAQNLVALYGYISHRLLQANLNGDSAILDEVEGLLKELKGAWEEIGNSKPVQPRIDQQQTEAPRASASYGKA